MNKIVFVALLFYGAYWYVSKHYEFHDTLEYAKAHPEKQSSAAVEYYVGMVYHQRSEYGKAAEAFQALLEQHPTDYYANQALMRYEESAEENHDWEKAKELCQKYIDDNPDGKKLELAKTRLEMLRYKHP